MSNQTGNHRATVRIVLIYALFGLLWICLSDNIIEWFVHDPAILTDIEILKGYVFILLTALLFYLLISRNVRKLEASEDELRRCTRRLIEVEENLRKQLATELHDEIGRDLTAVGMNLAIIGGSNDAASNKRIEVIEDSKQLTEGISRAVRGIMASLRPPVLDDFGLLAALRWNAEILAKRSGIVVSFFADDSFPRVAPEKEANLFRIAQEALVNVAKHADSQSVTISLRCEDGVILLAVGDDGKGFVLAPSVQDGAGWGMKIMRERAELIGGRFHVDSSPGKGTVISVNVPMEDV